MRPQAPAGRAALEAPLLEQVEVPAEQEDTGGDCHDGDEEAENGGV